jgi:hypothetical protein
MAWLKQPRHRRRRREYAVVSACDVAVLLQVEHPTHTLPIVGTRVMGTRHAGAAAGAAAASVQPIGGCQPPT